VQDKVEKSFPKRNKISPLHSPQVQANYGRYDNIRTFLSFNFSFFMSISHDMIEKITPLSDRLLLKPVEADKVTASGIIIPDSPNKERPSVYEVIAIGPGRIDKNGQEIKIDLKK
jgi:Chaperonin 10 Kd subunit